MAFKMNTHIGAIHAKTEGTKPHAKAKAEAHAIAQAKGNVVGVTNPLNINEDILSSPLAKRTKEERQANRAEKRKKKADRLSKGTTAQKNRAARIKGRAERSKIRQSGGTRGEKLDAKQKSRDKQKSSQTDLETNQKYKSRRGLEKGGTQENKKVDLEKYAPTPKRTKYGGM